MSRNCDIAAIWRRHRFDNLRSRTSPPATTSAVPVTEAVAETEAREETEEPEETEALIVEAVDALAARDPGAGGRIRLEITRVPWPVPAASADLDLLSLAVDNVLGNAAKYSSSGPIEVRLREEAGAAVIEVADSGRGIPAADLPQVFDELARATNARDVTGSGLGLTLVQTVVARHGGSVSLRSVEGSGSVVGLRIPLLSSPKDLDPDERLAPRGA